MIRQLIYSSVYTGSDSDADIHAILSKSRVKNAVRDITGFLLFSEGAFLQVLEGAPHSLQDLMRVISQDPRHSDIVLLQDNQVSQRLFAGWNLAYSNSCGDDTNEWAGLRNTMPLEKTIKLLGQKQTPLSETILKLIPDAINPNRSRSKGEN